MKIKIIGVGGTGSVLADLVSRYIAFLPEEEKWITLIDGDRVEEKNLTRQTLKKVGEFKVRDKCEQLKELYKNVKFSYSPIFVDERNISDLIFDGNIVFLCVDNHRTRKVVDEYCQALDNIVLVSSGNEETDGSCQIYIKKGGVEFTNPISRFHPEISEASDKLPNGASCEDIIEEDPQIFFTNATSAVIMCWLFRMYQERGELFEEVYFDIEKMKVQPSKRQVRRM